MVIQTKNQGKKERKGRAKASNRLYVFINNLINTFFQQFLFVFKNVHKCTVFISQSRSKFIRIDSKILANADAYLTLLPLKEIDFDDYKTPIDLILCDKRVEYQEINFVLIDTKASNPNKK